MGKTLRLRTSVDLSVTMATSVVHKSCYSHSSLSASMVQDERDINKSFKAYTIPRKERRPSEDCQFTLPVDSREAKEIEHAVRRLTWDTNDLDRAVSISHIKKVDNPNLEREYHEKRATLREEGRSPKELTQQLAFCVETEDSRVKEICRLGLECEGDNHILGDGGMGVTVWKCPDLCLRALTWPASRTAYLVVFKIVKGRVKSVTPKLSPETPNLEPTPNYDCHVSRNPASTSVTDLSTLMRSTQYYLYEYDDEGLPSKRPRHCLPFAVILLKKQKCTASPMKPPLAMPLEKPTSPVKESTKINEDMKTPSFSDEDGILAWRGLVTSNEKSLGHVSLLAGHKLGFNFWKSYLDVSRKIPLNQLGLMLPGDIKSAWKSPLLYRNNVLSLGTMKPTPRQPSEKFTSFTRYLSGKAKSAGVLCVDSFTTLFLVPSSKLAVHLGFCTAEKPPRMFCILCRRQSTPLSPPFIWPLASPVTPPADCRSGPFSNTSTTAGAFIQSASLDLKAQHKAKVMVTSAENKLRLSPKHPRQIAKRSLSFPSAPAVDTSKRLPKLSRSASTSGSGSFREDSMMKPMILSRPNVDNAVRRSSTESLGDDSRVIKADSSQIRTNWNVNSLLCLNSVSSHEKQQDGQSCNGFNGDQAKNTPNLNGVSANTSTSITPELHTTHISHLPSSRTCPNVSVKPNCGNSESETKLPTLDNPFKLQVNHSRNVLEFEPYFNPRSLSEPSFSKYDVKKTHPTIREVPITSSAMEDPGRGRSSTDETTHSWKRDLSSTNSFPAHRVLERARAAVKDSPSSSKAIGTLSSPTSRAFSPYWPDSPIVFSASDRIPFFTPVKTDGPDEEERTLSVKSDDNCCVNPSQPGNELIDETTTNLTTRMDEAHSTPRDLVKDPCGSLEEKTSQSKSLYLENWNKTSSFFNNKQALRSLRKAVAHQKSPKLNKSTKSSDNLQTIDMDISEPSDIESSDLSNAEKVDTLSKGATRPRIPQLQDNMQTVDMEISEFPECPIIVSHASSCDPSVPLNNSSFSSVADYINEHARDTAASSSHSTVISIDMEISEPSDIESSDLSNAEKVETWSKSATQPRIPQLHDDMQTLDMEISEFPECPIIVSHASSCAPLVPLTNSSFTPVADYINEHARDTAASSLISTVTKIAEPLLINSDVRNGCNQSAGSVCVKVTQQTELNSGNSSEHYDARVGRKQPAVNIITANVGLETLQSGDVAEPVDMDIADDVELLSNNVALDSDSISSAPAKMTEEPLSCNTDNDGKPLVPIEVTSDSNKNENSLAAGSNTSKQAVSEINEVTTPGVAEETKPEATTEAKLTSEKQCMVSSLGHDTDNHVTKDSEQEQVQNVLSKTSDVSTEKTGSPNRNSSSTCLLTERKVVGFSLSPQKSSKLCSRQLKTLQDAFTSATNCDESCMRVSDSKQSGKLSPTKPCKSLPRSSRESDSKTQDSEVRQGLKCDDNIDRPNSDNFAIKDESHDCKPLAVNCTSDERDVKYFPEHTDPQLGGVVETSLFQDWGLLSVDTDSSKFRSRKEDYSFAVEELEECTEVVDFGSETDLALEPIETWPLIMDCDHPEPETVFCSPMNSIETFTFRFPGKCGLNEDADEVSPTNTMTTEEETTLVEERYRGVCVEPEVVNCSDANSEIMSTSGDILPRIDPPDKNDQELDLYEHLKTSQSPCESSQMSHKVALVKPVSRTPVAKTHFDELLNKRGSLCEDSSSFKGSNSVEKEFQRTDNSTDRCSESPAPQNLETSENESVTQTKLPEISQSLESTKEDVSTPIFNKQDITCFAETLNTSPTASVKPSVGVALPTSASPLSVDYQKDTTATEKSQDVPTELDVICPVNSTVGRAKAVDCPSKLPSATEMNKNKKHSEKVAEKVKAAIVSPSESSVGEQEKRGNETSTENLQKVKCTQQMLRGTADPKQQKPISIRIKAMTLANGCTAEKMNSKSSKDQKQFTAAVNKDVKEKELSSGPPTQNSKKRHFTEAKSVKRDSYAVKYTFVKQFESRAKTVKHDKPVEETPKTVKIVSVTASQPRLSKKPESYPQVDKTKNAHSGMGPGVSSPGLSKKPVTYPQPDKTKETHSGMGPGVSSPGLSKKAEIYPKADKTKETHSGMGPSVSSPGLSKKPVSYPQADKTKDAHSGMGPSVSSPGLSKTPVSYPQADKTKETHSSTGSGVSSQGRSEPLGDMNDLQRDNRVPALKRNHTPEPESTAKQAKMDSVPVLVNAAGGVKNDHVPSEIKSNFVNNRNVYQPYKEKRQFEYNQAAYQRDSEAARLKQNHQQYQYPCWMAPPFPTQLPVRNGEWGGGGLPNPVPSHTQWYQPRGVPNQNQFQQVYTGIPQCGRSTFVPNMCKVRPMFEPTPAMPGPYVFPGNAYQVPYHMLGPR